MSFSSDLNNFQPKKANDVKEKCSASESTETLHVDISLPKKPCEFQSIQTLNSSQVQHNPTLQPLPNTDKNFDSKNSDLNKDYHIGDSCSINNITNKVANISMDECCKNNHHSMENSGHSKEYNKNDIPVPNEHEMVFNNKIYEKSLTGVANLIKDGVCKNIVVMCGAGISTSCGIPDFRSRGSGIFSQLAKYNLPYPELLFHLGFFCSNPRPFYHFMSQMAKSILNSAPSSTHYFLSFLSSTGLLRRIYTQNIDDLEAKAHTPREFIVQAHGSSNTAHCVNCKESVDRKEFIDFFLKIDVDVDSFEPPTCKSCGGLIKPGIIFYGENLPDYFFDQCFTDLEGCDLLIIIGTSLKVEPFSSLKMMVSRNTPRILINKDSVNTFVLENEKYSLDGRNYYNPMENDIFYKDYCDDAVIQFVKLMGLEQDYNSYIKSFVVK